MSPSWTTNVIGARLISAIMFGNELVASNSLYGTSPINAKSNPLCEVPRGDEQPLHSKASKSTGNLRRMGQEGCLGKAAVSIINSALLRFWISA